MDRDSTKARALLLRVLLPLFLFPAAFGQTFTVTPLPSALTIYPGQQNLPLAVTVGNSNYTGPISVTITGLPSGISVSPLTLTAGASGNLNLSATVFAGQEGFHPDYPTRETSWTAQVTVVAAAGAVRATSPLQLTISMSNPSFVPTTVNVPVVRIDTNGVGINDKVTDIPGTITITSADGQTSYLPSAANTDNTADFHLHGSSTTNMPKLAYHVKLNTSLDLLNVMGLSCPYVTSKAKPVCDKSKSYILLANFDDKTLIHDWAASALANAIPIGNGYLGSPANSPSPSGKSTLMPWASHSLFVELYLNGVYEGDYQLIEQIKVDSHRVNINELAETDVTDDISGGYLLEFDQHETEAYVFFTPQGLPIGLADPDFTPDAEIPQQTAYITNYVDTAETALFAENFTDPTLGWRKYFDEASAVNFYIVNDVMGNVDGGVFFSSTYMYKDKGNALLYMGPVWDFDISAGNVNYAAIVNPTVPWAQVGSAWYQQWFRDPGFKADVATQWNALKNNGVFTAWIASIQQQAQTIEQSQANNYQRWPMLGIKVWPNSGAVGTYDGEVQTFASWLQLRIAYLDSVFNNKTQTATTLTVGGGTLRSRSPVSLTAQVTGGANPSGAVSFLSNGVLLGSASLSGGTANLTTNNLTDGSYTLEAVFNGDATNGLSASAARMVQVAPALTSTMVSVGGPATAHQGASVSFSAAVIPNSGTAVATGAITFTVDGGAGIAKTLNGGGVATYSINSLGLGPHTISAAYAGDSNNAASSGSASITINIAPGFIISGTALSIKAGASSGNTSTITVTPTGGFTGKVSLGPAITSSPSGAHSLPSFSLGSTGVVDISSPAAETATLTVYTHAALSAALAVPAKTGTDWRKTGGMALACLLLMGIPARRRRWRTMLGVLALLVLVSGGVTSCGGGSSGNQPGTGTAGTAAGAYTITITGISGSTTATGTVSLLVQ